MVDYLGPVNFLILTNEESFKQDKYGSYAVDHHSTIFNIQSDTKTASYIPGLVQTDVL